MRIDAEAFVRVLAQPLRQAAGVARALEGRVRNRPKSGEATDVKAALTIADSAAQEALLIPLLEAFPGVSLEAEEDTPSVASFPSDAEAVVVMDPIDGTLRSYLEGRGPYAVMAGLAVERRYLASLVALPREGLFFDAVAGGAAHRARARSARRPVSVRAEGRRVLVSHELPEGVQDALRAAGFELAFGCGGAISVAPLIPGVRAGLRLVAGQGGVSTRGRIGALITRSAGGLVVDENGRPFPESIDEPRRALIAAADERDATALVACLET